MKIPNIDDVDLAIVGCVVIGIIGCFAFKGDNTIAGMAIASICALARGGIKEKLAELTKKENGNEKPEITDSTSSS